MRSPLVFPAASAVLSLVSASGCSGTETSSPAAAPPTADAPQVPEGDAGALGPGDATPAPDPGTKGCAIAPKGAGTFAARTLTAAGKSRTYHLAVPAGAQPKQALPLLFVLHGATNTAPENLRRTSRAWPSSLAPAPSPMCAAARCPCG